MARIMVRLECNHFPTYEPDALPRKDDVVFCLRCQRLVFVEKVFHFEWRFQCSRCKLTRWYGQLEQDAKRAQRKHYDSKHHLGALRYTNRLPLETKGRK